MRFSFVIPAHNEEKAIGKCLGSIIGQEGKPRDIEIIVVNDGSSDGTRKIAEKYMKNYGRIRMINFTGGHSAAFARNRGAKKAKGEWIIFIDADQIVENEFAGKVGKFIEANPEIDGSDYFVLSYNPKTVFQKAWSAYRKCYPSIGFIHIIRKSVFEKLDGFNEKVFYFEDAEFMNRFHNKGYRFKGPIDTKLYHIEPETWKDFSRQRRWQGRQAPLKYFLPCIFPPLMLVQFFKIWLKSRDFVNTIYWTILDFAGRYVSLFWRVVKKRI